VDIASQIGQPIVEILEPICRPPFTPERMAACAKLSFDKTQAARAAEAGSFTGKFLQPLVQSVGSFLLPGSGVVTSTLTGVESASRTAETLRARQTVLNQFAGGPMAFQDGDSGFSFDNFFGGVGQALQGGLGQQLLGIGTQALSGFVGQQFAPQPQLVTSMAAVPAMGRAGAVVARGFFNKFPNLAVAIQKLRNSGANVTRGSLWSLMKRFGPDFLISGGILTAVAVSELAIAGPGRRRMNPGNIKALRKAHRRMKAFHNVCRTNDMMLGGRRTSKKKSFAGGATSVVNVK